MKRLFLLLALAMPFFLYGKEPSIFTPTLSADALVFDDTVATTDSAGGTDLIVRPDTPKDLTVAADTLPKDILEVYLAHIANKEHPQRVPRKASNSTPHLDSTIVIKNGEIFQKIIYQADNLGRDYRTITYSYTNGVPNGNSTIEEHVYEGTTIGDAALYLMTSHYSYRDAKWIGSSRTEYVLDDLHNTITKITYQWNTTYQFWTPTNSITYKPRKVKQYYDVEEEIHYNIGTNNKLIPISLHKKDWDERGNKILDVYYNGGVVNGEWKNLAGDTKIINEYTLYMTRDRQTLEEIYTWDNSVGWKGANKKKTTWVYSKDGTLTLEKIIYNWDASNNAYYRYSGTFNDYLKINNIEDQKYPTLSETCIWSTTGVMTGRTCTYTRYTGTHKDSTIVNTWIANNGRWYPSQVTIYSPTNTTTAETISWFYNNNGVATSSSRRTLFNTDTITINGTTTITNNIVFKWDPSILDWTTSTKKIIYQGLNWTATVNYKYINGLWIVDANNSSKVYSSTQNGEEIHITYVPQNGIEDTIWTIAQGTKIVNSSSNGTMIHLEYASETGGVTPIWTITTGTKTFNSSIDGTTIHLEYTTQAGGAEPVWLIASGTKSIVNTVIGIETTHLNYIAATGTEDPPVWIENGGSRVLNISSADTIGSITYIYTASSSSVIGIKTLNTTDISGNSIYLKWQLTLNDTDSVWNIIEGTKVPQDEVDSHGKTTRILAYYWNTEEHKWKVSSGYIYEYDYRTNEAGELVQEVQLGLDSTIISETTRQYNEMHMPTVIVNYDHGTPSYRQEYTYADDGITVKDNTHYIGWNNICNSWDGISKKTTLYDENVPTLQTALIQYLWTNCNWELWTEQYTFYDENNRDTLTINKLYGENKSKIAKSYSGNSLIKNNTYQWLNSEWVLINRDETLANGVSIIETYSNDGSTLTYRKTTNEDGSTDEINLVAGTETSTTYLNGNKEYIKEELNVTSLNPDGSPATYTLTTNYYNTEE